VVQRPAHHQRRRYLRLPAQASEMAGAEVSVAASSAARRALTPPHEPPPFVSLMWN
jgi:hypothetical protein